MNEAERSALAACLADKSFARFQERQREMDRLHLSAPSLIQPPDKELAWEKAFLGGAERVESSNEQKT
jgi:hypothetical protein